MEVRRVTNHYNGHNVQIEANEANDVRLILSALKVYRNQLSSQQAISQALRNGQPSPTKDNYIYSEMHRVDAMSDLLLQPQPLAEEVTVSQDTATTFVAVD